MLQVMASPLPDGIGERMVLSMWLLFVLVIVSSYTANLTVFLGAKSDEIPFSNWSQVYNKKVFFLNLQHASLVHLLKTCILFLQLIEQDTIPYTIPADTADEMFFQTTSVELLKKAYQKAKADGRVKHTFYTTKFVEQLSENSALFSAGLYITAFTNFHLKKNPYVK